MDKDFVKEELKTSEDWSHEFDFYVLDPDAWDRTNFEYSWNEELITRKEFERRAMGSTLIWGKSL